MSIVVDNVLPVFAVMALGFLFRRWDLINDEFRRLADRLVYYVLLPALLFWKVSGRARFDLIDWPGILAVMGAAATGLVVSLIAARGMRLTPLQTGAMSHCAYRFNAYVGLAICLSAFGDEGAALFGVLIGFMVPYLNLLAVSTLIWYSEEEYSRPEKIRLLVKEVASNPLILAGLTGILYANSGLSLAPVVQNTLSLLSVSALPLGLLSIGGGLSLEKIQGRVLISVGTAVIKLAIMPVIGYLWLGWLGVTGLQMVISMVFFALSSAPSCYILTVQMNSDADLAAAIIALNTLLSIISLSVVLAVFG